MTFRKEVELTGGGEAAEAEREAFSFTRFDIERRPVQAISRDAVADGKVGLAFSCDETLLQDYVSCDARNFNLSHSLAATSGVNTDRRRIIKFPLSSLSRRPQETGRYH